MTPKPFLRLLVNLALCLPCCSREIFGFPGRFFTMMGKSAVPESELGKQTKKYLRRLLRKVKSTQKHLRKTLSAACFQWFGDSEKPSAVLPGQMRANASSICNEPMGGAGLFYPAVCRKRFNYFSLHRWYQAMLNNPDQFRRKFFSILNRLHAFRRFMRENLQLAGLFGMNLNLLSYWRTFLFFSGINTFNQ